MKLSALLARRSLYQAKTFAEMRHGRLTRLGKIDRLANVIDPNRVIGEDKTHGLREDHHFCLGRVGNGIITVRFTFRADVIRIFGPDIGEKENGSMSEKIQYKNGPKGDWRVVETRIRAP